MRLSRDDTAASPLVVILSFVAVAVILTALGYALLFDRPEPALQVIAVDDGSTLAFEVTQTDGNLAWSDVTLQLLDRAGTDQAPTFLQAPGGDITAGDRIATTARPPAGTYVLLLLHDGDELSRLLVTL